MVCQWKENSLGKSKIVVALQSLIKIACWVKWLIAIANLKFGYQCKKY